MLTLDDKLLQDALSLPSDLRCQLIEKLIQSLNVPIDSEIDKLWVEESERRVKEIETSDADLIPGEVVFRKIQRRNKKN
jgi:hypothetical protein